MSKDNFDLSKGGVKFDEGKARMDLIPPEALFEIAQVFSYGADKYDAWNWCKGLRWGRTIAAAIRHIFQWIGGEDNDKETGRNHLAHAGCCIMMLLSMIQRGAGEDDRYKGESTPLSTDDYNLITTHSVSVPLDRRCGNCTFRHTCGLVISVTQMPCASHSFDGENNEAT